MRAHGQHTMRARINQLYRTRFCSLPLYRLATLPWILSNPKHKTALETRMARTLFSVAFHCNITRNTTYHGTSQWLRHLRCCRDPLSPLLLMSCVLCPGFLKHTHTYHSTARTLLRFFSLSCVLFSLHLLLPSRAFVACSTKLGVLL